MKKLGIIGAGGHGKVVADIACAVGWKSVFFFDRLWPSRKSNGRWPIVNSSPNSWSGALFCAVGNNLERARIFSDVNIVSAPTLVHPSAVISPYAELRSGTLAVAGVVVNTDATVGRGVILNTGCSVDHDCQIGDFVHISPGVKLAGNVTIGPRSWIGIGSTIIEGITVGADAIVGAGAVVVTDVPDNARFAGVPARSMQ